MCGHFTAALNWSDTKDGKMAARIPIGDGEALVSVIRLAQEDDENVHGHVLLKMPCGKEVWWKIEQ